MRPTSTRRLTADDRSLLETARLIAQHPEGRRLLGALALVAHDQSVVIDWQGPEKRARLFAVPRDLFRARMDALDSELQRERSTPELLQ